MGDVVTGGVVADSGGGIVMLGGVVIPGTGAGDSGAVAGTAAELGQDRIQSTSV